MDQCTHDVRSAHWKSIIQNCQRRPVGQSIKQWLKENDVLAQSYYYWQRKLRNEAYTQIEKVCLPSVQDADNKVSFVEISEPTHQINSTAYTSDIIKPAAVIKTATMSIAITNDISDQLLSKILQEVSHA